ncbi:MFS transporter [Gordonia liuliyuniae]|uniref:MFS transporter n=1 Tax=Gordonia liuliyuniae TaxID=2911517 RepID=A0ABS9IUA0_9ACTN|nr:MFS transporter [Gordonia liuliyuniae]MCF8589144.1 MFS transporter [Gordonia liuliyuniae]
MGTQLTPSPAIVRRASTAGLLGTVVESYDFIVYVFVIAYTAPLFFPSDSSTAATLASLAALGTGFVARPLGGLFFGRLGDRRGRRFTLVTTIVAMGISTTLIGLLPTYSTIGVAAPILLVVLRLAQGFAAGGEQMGSTTFISEHAGKSNHGRLSAVTPIGFTVGTAVAPAVVTLVSFILSDAAMNDWGWRIPLLLSLPLTATCLLLRTRLEDSPEFRRIADESQPVRDPLRELFRQYWRVVIRLVILSAAILMIGYILAAYLPVYLNQEVGVEPGRAAAIAAVGTAGAIIVLMVSAMIIDRLGRRGTLVVLLVVLGCVIFPVMYSMKATDGNFTVSALGYALTTGLSGAAAIPAYAALTAVFPARVRYSGAAIAFGLGSAIGGGAGPYLAAKVTAVSGNPYSAAVLIVIAAVVAIVAFGTIPTRGVADDDGRIDGASDDRQPRTSVLKEPAIG